MNSGEVPGDFKKSYWGSSMKLKVGDVINFVVDISCTADECWRTIQTTIVALDFDSDGLLDGIMCNKTNTWHGYIPAGQQYDNVFRSKKKAMKRCQQLAAQSAEAAS